MNLIFTTKFIRLYQRRYLWWSKPSKTFDPISCTTPISWSTRRSSRAYSITGIRSLHNSLTFCPTPASKEKLSFSLSLLRYYSRSIIFCRSILFVTRLSFSIRARLQAAAAEVFELSFRTARSALDGRASGRFFSIRTLLSRFCSVPPRLWLNTCAIHQVSPSSASRACNTGTKWTVPCLSFPVVLIFCTTAWFTRTVLDKQCQFEAAKRRFRATKNRTVIQKLGQSSLRLVCWVRQRCRARSTCARF